MILIISHLADEHANEVVEHLVRARTDVLLFDTARFPREIKLSVDHQTGTQPSLRAMVNGLPHDLSTVRTVWWRRPCPFNLNSSLTDANDRNFAYNESQAAISGLWSCLDAHWINNPERDEIASRKLYQLKVAASIGLTIPKTLVTNDPLQATEFIDSQGDKGTIYKAFSGTEQSWRETRLLKSEERAHLAAVQYAPVIFQEYIRADIDLRITMIGDDVFPAEIHTGQTEYKVDFRMNILDALVRAHTLPDAIVQKLRTLMKTLGLVYGAIDMRLKPDGEYVFLEINPSGQWLFIEERTGQPITQALVHRLQKHE